MNLVMGQITNSIEHLTVHWKSLYMRVYLYILHSYYNIFNLLNMNPNAYGHTSDNARVSEIDFDNYYTTDTD